jgi:hypothetical protein
MLLADIKVEDRHGLRHEVAMKIHRRTPGPLADYLCSATDREIVFRDYPRWSECTAGLVARAAAALRLDELLPPGQDIARLKAAVQLVMPSKMPIFELRFSEGRLNILDKGPPESITSVNLAPGPELVLRCLRYAAWREDKEPPVPPVVSPPVRDGYIRLRDVPDPARSGLEAALHRYKWGQPVFPGEGECIWLADWERFIEG